MRISLLYLGCKVNQAEIAEMERQLRGQGHDIVGLDDTPDVCVINTCTVTAKSDYQSRQLIRRAARTGAKVIATGCYTEMNQQDVGGIDADIETVSNADKYQLIKMISSNSFIHEIHDTRQQRARYLLKVQDGCNNSCSYCIVWKARGKSRSISLQEAVSEATYAANSGYNEIILTGIHLGTYGLDIDTSLSDLIEALLSKTSIPRIRLSSLEVGEIDERLARLISSEQRVCPHLHIPLQSGDDSVLKSMGRGYTSAFFKERVLWLSELMPDMALGTDVIAGYPTESLEALDNTLKLISSLPFSYLHVFPYSIRPNTIAAGLPDKVGDNERKQRADELRNMAASKKSGYMQRQIGRSLVLLAERKDSEGRWTGTTENYLKATIAMAGLDIKRGSLINIEVSSHDGSMLLARPA